MTRSTYINYDDPRQTADFWAVRVLAGYNFLFAIACLMLLRF